MKRFTILFTLFFVLGACAFAQDQPEDETSKGFDKSKLFFGGNFGLSFGDYSFINITPQVGYRFNKFFAAGAGLNFLYSSIRYRYSPSTYDYKDNYGVAGLNIFGRVYPIDYIFVQLQPELNYTWGKEIYYNGSPEAKLPGEFIPSLLGGAGGAIPAGRSGAFIIMVQYDLLQNNRSPYGKQAFFTFGFNMGF